MICLFLYCKAEDLEKLRDVRISYWPNVGFLVLL